MNPSNATKTSYSYGTPTQVGKITFTPPGTDLKCETAYWLWGDLGSKVTPLIVLHGGPGAPGRDWKPVAALHETHGIPVLLYDQLGCGASSHLRETKGDTSFWTTELFLAELENVKKHLQIERFDLLGHSCGAMIAVSYTLTQPQGLRKLIISSSSPSEELRAQGHATRRAELPQNLQDAMAECEEEGRFDSPEYQSADLELMRRSLCRLDPWPSEIEETMALMSEDDTVISTLYGGTPLKPTGPWKDYNVRSRLPEITETTVPGGVLLTNGRYDISTDETMAPFFTQIRAKVKWVRFAESSHMAHLEEPHAFLTALGDFLTMV